MQVQRKAVTAGNAVTFTFDVFSNQFLVKNFSDGQIEVGILGSSILIPAHSAQHIVTRLEPRAGDLTNTLTVTPESTDANGVEIQCLNY